MNYLMSKSLERARSEVKTDVDELEITHRQYFNRQQIRVLPIGSLAKRVGDEIEQLKFETETAVLYDSLTCLESCILIIKR